MSAGQYLYGLEYQSVGGRWVRIAVFGRPLDADRAFELLTAAGTGARRPLQVIRFTIVAATGPQED